MRDIPYSNQDLNRWFDEIRLAAKQRGAGISNDEWFFYYDETNNIRNLIYKNEAISDERRLKSEFIIGGLAFTNDEARARAIDAAKRLPQTNGEIKSRAVLSKSHSINTVLKRNETTHFIDILDSEGIYLHFCSQNNFYMAISPIVDSLVNLPRFAHLISMRTYLKNQLDTFAGDKPKAFLDEIRRFGYPSIEGDSSKPFCDYILSVLDDGLARNPIYIYSDAGRIALLLREMIASVRDTGELTISPRNDADTLINGFLFNYMQSCAIFPDSYHVFDMEETIADQVGTKALNFEFVDSRNSVPVQLSDVFVRLLARVFDYLDAIDPRDFAAAKSKLCERSLRNMQRLWLMLKKSMAVHPALINGFSSPTELVLRQLYLEQFLSTGTILDAFEESSADG